MLRYTLRRLVSDKKNCIHEKGKRPHREILKTRVPHKETCVNSLCESEGIKERVKRMQGSIF